VPKDLLKAIGDELSTPLQSNSLTSDALKLVLPGSQLIITEKNGISS